MTSTSAGENVLYGPKVPSSKLEEARTVPGRDVTGGLTVSGTRPLTPSFAVAPIVVMPPVTPVTSPAPATVATAGLELAPITDPVSALPAASRRVAVACVCPPTLLGEAGFSAIDTVATGPR